MTGGTPPAPRVDASRETAINDVPQDVIETALAAFDAFRPGVDVLGLVSDSRSDVHGRGGDGVVGRTGEFGDADYVLRYASAHGAASVTVRVRARVTADQIRLDLTVHDGGDVAMAVEQLGPSLRLVQHGRVPAVFEGVHPGFVSITGTRLGAADPLWATAWTRL